MNLRTRLLRPVAVSVAVVLGAISSGYASQVFSADQQTLEQQLLIEVNRFVEGDRQAPPPPCQVLFVGSSSIVMWKDPSLIGGSAGLT